jgi:hypothetical protein
MRSVMTFICCPAKELNEARCCYGGAHNGDSAEVDFAKCALAAVDYAFDHIIFNLKASSSDLNP